MNKVLKVALKVISYSGVGAAGYFIGFKIGKKKTFDWAQGEINSILKAKNEEIDILEHEQLADLGKLTPEVLEQLEYGKSDEVELVTEEETDIPFDEPVEIKEETDIPEKEVKKSTSKKKPKKTPYMIDDEEFDRTFEDYDRFNLTIDENGDLYDDESNELYTDREHVGEKLINRMLRDVECGDAMQWFVRNEAMNAVYDITFSHSR